MRSKAHPVAALLALALAASAGPARDATAEVEYVKPESFTDTGRRFDQREHAANLDALKRHLVESAARQLPADQTLAVTVTDVDLAGAYEPWQMAHNEIRIVKDIYPPRIELHFRLARADGSVVKEGDRTLRDSAFLMSGNPYAADALRYEKAMLDEWLGREFRR
jgi:hypothetical protein